MVIEERWLLTRVGCNRRTVLLLFLFILHVQLTLHERGQMLDMAVYEQASQALDDDFEDVRLVAIRLIWVFSLGDPERLVGL